MFIQEALYLLREYNGTATHAISIVDREEGAIENLRSYDITLNPILTTSDLGITRD